jgi:hypothetical protein
MIAHPPSGPKKRFMLDNEFFIALAEGDTSKMESVLRELTTPAAIKRRFDSENGYSEGLTSTFGVIYAKIAWRHAIGSPLPVSIFTTHLAILKPPSKWLFTCSILDTACALYFPYLSKSSNYSPHFNLAIISWPDFSAIRDGPI